MLEEFMAFNGEKMPRFESKTPTYIWNIKLNKSLNKSIYATKYSKLNMESLKDFKEEEEEMTLAEKIYQRQLEEKERIEEKKRKIIKDLHTKKKRINLKKFLIRETGYEQKKQYNLEQKRFKELEEENKNFKDKPLLSSKTIEIIDSSKKKKKPIYLRTREILENRQKNLENLNIKLKKENKTNKLNKSMDQINNNNDNNIYIVNNEIKNKKMTKNQIMDYYQKQYDWKKKVNEKRAEEDLIKNENEEREYKSFFHPKISRGTKEIILAMNEAKENYLYQTIESNNNYYLTDTSPNPNYLNYDNDVFKRLYENKKIENLNKYTLLFQPTINKNKYKKVMPKYKDNIINNKKNKKRKSKKIKKKKEISVDFYKFIGNKKVDANNSKKESNLINEPWTNYLLKLKKNKSCDVSYKLNIRQSSAWNENDINIVPYKGESREIIKNFI